PQRAKARNGSVAPGRGLRLASGPARVWWDETPPSSTMRTERAPRHPHGKASPQSRRPEAAEGGGPNFGSRGVEPRPPTRFARRRNRGNFFTSGRLAQEGLWLGLGSEISSRGRLPYRRPGDLRFCGQWRAFAWGPGEAAAPSKSRGVGSE